MLTSVLKHRKAVVCLTEKMCVLDKLHPGMSYSAVGLGFSVDESTIYMNNVFLNRNTCKTKLCLDWLTKM